MELNRKNYFSKEAEDKYLGSSSLKAWDRYHEATEVFGHEVGGGCEAREIAKVVGEWEDKEKKCFLIGNYIHSYFSSKEDFQDFCNENHSTIYKPKGGTYADFVKAGEMIATLEKDKVVMEFMKGEHEQIFTGKIAGVEFKIQVDILNIERGYFADIKTTENITKKHYNSKTKEKESFIHKYDYFLQFAIYSEILRQNYGFIIEKYSEKYSAKELSKIIELEKTNEYMDCYIIAVDKQPIPGKEIIYMQTDLFIKEKLEEIELKLPNIMAVRNGEIEPVRCNSCDYCRSTKIIKQPIHYLDLLEDN